MKKATLKTIINAFNAASDDQTRYHLMGVLVTPNEVVATNGHYMSVVPHGDAELFKVDHWVSKDQLPILKLLLKDYKSFEETKHTVNAANVEVQSLDGHVVTQIKTCDAQSIKYPNWKALIPNYKQDAPTIGLNAEYILDLARAIKDDDVKTMAVAITYKDKLSPVIFTNGKPGNIGVLMPVRI